MKKLLLGFFLLTNMAHAQVNKPTILNGFCAKLNPTDNNSNGNEEQPENTIWQEKIDQRTAFAAHFSSNDGQVKSIFSKEPIHYKDDAGKWEKINPTLKQVDDQHWAALDQANPTYFKNNGSASLSLAEGILLTVGQHTRINNSLVHPTFNIHNNTAEASLADNMTKTIQFSENKFKYSYVLNNTFASNAPNLYLDEQLEIPAGYSVTLIDHENYPASMVTIRDEKGNIKAQFREPFCYDAANQWMIGKYSLIDENNTRYLRISIPTEWLNDAERNYPVVIDPIVVGPTANWTGGTMPSCIIPEYNKDSIQVTIPAGVTATGLFVTASFYADPFTTATMGQGEMKFSTTCGTSQAFVVSGANLTLPGTAYLDSFNILSPLMCCFPEACTNTNFYLTMNLGRTGPAAGCNTTYIRYDPFTTSWPFQAVVLGKTAESYGSKWNVPNTPICSNQCTITGTAYAYYGVAPYTYTHPWTTEVVTQGQNLGCGNGSNNHQFTLTIPDCPKYCDPATTLTVPPPVITDACGNIVGGMPNETVTLIMAPSVSAQYDTLVCSGSPYSIPLTSCAPDGDILWEGNNQQDTAIINDVAYNSGSALTTISYSATTSSNGCNSDTLVIQLYVAPPLNLDFTWNPDPVIVSTPTNYTGNTNPSVGPIVSWGWFYDQLQISNEQMTNVTFDAPGDYVLCLGAEAANGCIDTICKTIPVIPATIIAPNIITPNGDGINDLLEFKYLEFYPDNHLSIINRWGNVVLDLDGYKNDWNGGLLTEGTYFYKLTVPANEQELSGFFQIER